MSNKITSLLFKNGFRVFGKTKVLATQLTVLTTLAATSLMTTIMTNYNLNESKKAVLDKGDLFDFSIDTNLQNENAFIVEKIDLKNEKYKDFNLEPQYKNHLNNVIETREFVGGTNLLFNGQNFKTLPSINLWTNDVPLENQKLTYYFAIKPNESGQGLFKYGDDNSNNVASLINIPNELLTKIISQSSEIFSFSQGNNAENKGIPTIYKNKFINDSIFDLRNIYLDNQGNIVGSSPYGFVQINGFGLQNSITLNHNVVNTTKISQLDFEQFKNVEGRASVPNEINIFLGDQNQYMSNYFNYTADYYNFLNSTNEIRTKNAVILASIGDSFNQIAKSKSGIINDTKWTPHIVSLDPNKIRGATLFCYKLLFDNPNNPENENNFFNTLYKELIPLYNFHKKEYQLIN